MTFAAAPENVLFACPQCQWSGEFDARFPGWCQQCDHGLNAMTPKEREVLDRAKPRARRKREAAQYLDAMPQHEYLRQARISEARGTAVDSTHPATHLRTRLLEARPQRAASVTVTEEEWAAVDRELAPMMGSWGARLLR